MLNLFSKIGDWFGRACSPDIEDDFDPEDPAIWGDEEPPRGPRLYDPYGHANLDPATETYCD